jgi:hypothetical protein
MITRIGNLLPDDCPRKFLVFGRLNDMPASQKCFDNHGTAQAAGQSPLATCALNGHFFSISCHLPDKFFLWKDLDESAVPDTK